MATPPPRPTTRDLFNQFITLLILMIALSVSLTFLFVQTPAPAQTSASTIVIIWDGMRPDMASDRLTPRLAALGANGVVALDHHAVFPTTALVQTATWATGFPPGGGFTTTTGPGSGQVIAAETPTSTDGSGVIADAPYWVLPGSPAYLAPSPTSIPQPPSPSPPTPSPAATATTTPSPAATATTTPSPAATATPSAPPAAVTGVQHLANPQTLLQLQQSTLGNVLLSPTLAERIVQAGMRVSFEGTAGRALLPTLAQVAHGMEQTYVIDDDFVYPATLHAQVDPLLAQRATLGQGTLLTRLWLQTLQPLLNTSGKPFFSVIDIPDIERAAAEAGIGSPEQLAAIRATDANLGTLLDALNDQHLLTGINVIVTSDHGMLGVLQPDQQHLADQQVHAPSPTLQLDFAARLQGEARRGTTGALPDVGINGIATERANTLTTLLIARQNGPDLIYFPDTPAVAAVGNGDQTLGRSRLARAVVKWIQGQPWAGPIFVNEGLGPIDGTFPLHNVFLAASRAPALVVTFASQTNDVGSPTQNPLGFVGATYADTTQLATSGGLNRREIQTIFFAHGPSFRTQVRDFAPTGAVDLAPTIARILGLPDLKKSFGRPLTEMLTGGADLSGQIARSHLSSTAKRADGTVFYQYLAFASVGQTHYLQGAVVLTGSASESEAVFQQRAQGIVGI